MQYSRFVNQTPSVASELSSQPRRTNRLIKSPVPSDYEYIGRLVTRERPVVHKSKSLHQNLVFSQNKYQYNHSTAASQPREVYDDANSTSSGDDNPDGLNRPVGIIRINDRHLREIYRLPTPPPKVKRVYHRLRSPETKVIERVFVRRPPPEIIENIIEVPPEKVRIINREKYLENTKPITRSKLIHLKARPHHRKQEREQEQQSSIASEQFSQQTSAPGTAPPQSTTGSALVFSPQANACTIGQMYPTSPQATSFNSQQPAQPAAQQMTQPSVPYTYVPQQTPDQQATQPSVPYAYVPQQTTNQQMFQPTPYTYVPQQATNQQMFQSTPYDYQTQQPSSQQMFQTTPYDYQSQQPNAQQMYQSTPYTYQPQQPSSQQMYQSTPYTYQQQQPNSQQMPQSTPYPYQSQQAMPNCFYGYAQQ